MKVIAITNRKGGVGKSTMAVHIAAGLAARGKRVGLVDTDSQGNSSLMLGMEPVDGLFNVLAGGQLLAEAIRPVPAERFSAEESAGELWLLPSHSETAKLTLALSPEDIFVFLEMVEAFSESKGLDVIFLDTAPTLSAFDGFVYMAVDGFIYVTECERLSFDGVENAMRQMLRFSKSRARYLGGASRVVGIIPNKLLANTVLHRYAIADLKQSYGDVVWNAVVHRIAWAEAASLGRMVYLHEPAGHAAQDARYIIDQVEGALATWPEKTT
jgi:chromosome partitioning protein